MMPELQAGTLSLRVAHRERLVLQQHYTLCCQQSCSRKINPSGIIKRRIDSECLKPPGTADLLPQNRGQGTFSSRARAFPSALHTVAVWL